MDFKTFAENEYMPYAKVNKKSWKDDDNKLKLEIILTFGRMPLVAVGARDVETLLMKVKKRASGATANRYRSLLSQMFSLAVE